VRVLDLQPPGRPTGDPAGKIQEVGFGVEIISSDLGQDPQEPEGTPLGKREKQ